MPPNSSRKHTSWEQGYDWLPNRQLSELKKDCHSPASHYNGSLKGVPP